MKKPTGERETVPDRGALGPALLLRPEAHFGSKCSAKDPDLGWLIALWAAQEDRRHPHQDRP